MAQSNLATAPLGCELEPGESIDRHRIGLDAAHIAQRDVGVAPFQQRADTLAEPREVGASDGACDRKGDRFRCRRVHLGVDRRGGKNSSLADR